MNSFCVVKGFDILEYAQTRFVEILKLFELGPFVFQRPEEAFNNGVVITASRSTQRAGGSHDLLKRFAGVLATCDQWCRDAIALFPANDFAAEQSQSPQQIDSASAGK